MNKLILTLVVGAFAAFVGQPVAYARGTGGAHEPSHGASHASQPHSSQPHSSGQPSHSSQSGSQHGSESQALHGSQTALPTDAGFGGSSGKSSAAGYAAAEHKKPPASGAGGAAAGAAVAKNQQPKVSGAGGAAAGAAVAKNQQPKVSGAGGAAAGAAVAKNREPQYSGAEGAAAGAAVANNRGPQVSGAAGATAGYAAAAHRTVPVSDSVALARGAAVRSNFNHPNLFGQQWYGAHADAWHPAAWAAGASWSAPAWPAVGAWCGWGNNVQPINYDYGNNVVYQDNQVYSDGEPVASADEYYQTAAALAQSTSTADAQSGEWLPLGVFAVVQGDQSDTSKVFELALDKSGKIAGNFNDLLTDTTLPIRGAVDKKTQRAAWTVGESKHNVWNTGLANLTKNQAQALVHFGKDKTQQWMLVRIKQPTVASAQ